MKSIIAITLLCVCTYTFGQDLRKTYPLNFRQLKSSLDNSQRESEFTISFPLKNGVLSDVKLKYTSISGYQPSDILTYSGRTELKNYPFKLTLTPSGLSGVYKSEEGLIYFESTDKTNEQIYIYSVEETENMGRGTCGVVENLRDAKEDSKNYRIASISPFPVGSQLRTYRLAAAAGGEMTVAMGGQTQARDKIVAIVNASNLIYELEASITFSLIAESISTMNIIFPDSLTDPYTNVKKFASAGNSQTAFDAMATSGLLIKSKYDVGHTFQIIPDICYICGTAGPDPCNDNGKARGMTQFSSSGVPVGSIANLYTHEVGHQFRAWHTYNANGGSSSNPTFCTSGWDNATAVEPGSGSTIMGYGSNCSFPTNYVLSGNNNDGYFNVKSLEQIYNSVANTSANRAGSCVNNSALANTPPVVIAGIDRVIPKGTPFVLTGTATDANTAPGNLTYVWEQFDIATASDRGAFGSNIMGNGGYTAVNSPNSAPLFRSLRPTNNGSRTFPDITHILNSGNNPNDNVGEDLPLVARNLNFRLTVRDNETGGGGVDSDNLLVTVANSGPFEVLTGNGPTLWSVGSNVNITWAVNGTNLTPVSCTNVKISTSTNGGVTFTDLIASTPNDGVHPFVVPNTISTQFRIKIEAVGNIFFDINNRNIIITDQPCAAETNEISDAAALSAVEGSATLNLGLVGKGSQITSFTGSISTSSPPSILVFKDENNLCSKPFSNAPRHELLTFIASSNSATTFTINSGTLPSDILNLYSGTYDANNQCSNWLNSSAVRSTAGGSIITNSSVTQTLNTNNRYQLRVSGFGSSDVGTFNITTIGGNIFNILPSNSSPYDYTFLVVNTVTNQIKMINNTGNLTTMAPGSFVVYGLSYAGGIDLSQYINTTFTSFQAGIANSTICAKLSTNSKNIKITACPSIPNAPSASGTTVISGTQATITASGCSGTYKWYDSPVSGNLLFSGNSYTSPTININSTFYVSCLEICESARTAVNISVISYCNTPSMNCSSGDLITNVKLSRNAVNILNQTSTCGTNGFTFYSTPVININPNESLTVSVTKNTQYREGLAVWIDFNANGVFETIERVMSLASNQTATQSQTFTVPANANAGNLKMRVKIDYNVATTDPCLAQDNEGPFGEVEDYLLNLVPIVNCLDLVTLVSTANDITNGVLTIRTNNNPVSSNQGLIRASNKITGGNTTYSAGKKIELNQGFEARGNVVFKAEIGGCSN